MSSTSNITRSQDFITVYETPKIKENHFSPEKMKAITMLGKKENPRSLAGRVAKTDGDFDEITGSPNISAIAVRFLLSEEQEGEEYRYINS